MIDKYLLELFGFGKNENSSYTSQVTGDMMIVGAMEEGFGYSGPMWVFDLYIVLPYKNEKEESKFYSISYNMYDDYSRALREKTFQCSFGVGIDKLDSVINQVKRDDEMELVFFEKIKNVNVTTNFTKDDNKKNFEQNKIPKIENIIITNCSSKFFKPNWRVVHKPGKDYLSIDSSNMNTDSIKKLFSKAEKEYRFEKL